MLACLYVCLCVCYHTMAVSCLFPLKIKHSDSCSKCVNYYHGSVNVALVSNWPTMIGWRFLLLLCVRSFYQVISTYYIRTSKLHSKHSWRKYIGGNKTEDPVLQMILNNHDFILKMTRSQFCFQIVLLILAFAILFMLCYQYTLPLVVHHHQHDFDGKDIPESMGKKDENRGAE